MKKEFLMLLEHQHDDECGCGCSHDHEEHVQEHSHEEHEHHHHEHGDSCGCGHDHEHEHHHHEHGDECGCGHHHEGVNAHGKRVYILENLGCANCAAKMEKRINELPGVAEATITYATKQLRITAANPDRILPKIKEVCAIVEPDAVIKEMERKPSVKKEEEKKKEKPITRSFRR